MDIVNSVSNKKEYENNIEIQRETFVASLGHDLKNPTIAQIRALELCLKGDFGYIAPPQREILEMVLDSCRYMNAMLCSLLATYRCEKGTIKLACDAVSIPDLASECIDEMIYLAKDKDISIINKNTAKNPCIYGDRVQLKRVIMNLLSNGIKYAYRNTELLIKIFNEGKNTVFLFENNSAYIPEDKREKIFARYVTFAQAHQELGIGLGLYTSKKIIEAHNGIIFVESFKENRNIFGFKIPFGEKYKDTIRKVTF